MIQYVRGASKKSFNSFLIKLMINSIMCLLNGLRFSSAFNSFLINLMINQQLAWGLHLAPTAYFQFFFNQFNDQQQWCHAICLRSSKIFNSFLINLMINCFIIFIKFFCFYGFLFGVCDVECSLHERFIGYPLKIPSCPKHRYSIYTYRWFMVEAYVDGFIMSTWTFKCLF